jgi:hypothetical protein
MYISSRLRTAFKMVMLTLALFAALPARAQEAGNAASAYTIGGIAVDVVGHSTDEARATAYRLAQRKAWPELWARMTGQGAATAPNLGDSVIESMVAGVEIQGERFSTTRYIATLGVVFDRARASDYFTAVTGTVHSEPMLLLPVLQDGGNRVVYESKTPWVLAWQRYSEAISPIAYVMAIGSPGDNLLLTSYQTQRPDRVLWRNILSRFKAVDVLIADVKLTRSWPGGPIDALFVARHGPDATELGRFSLSATSPAGFDAMLDTGVRQIDAIYGQALRDGRLRAEPDLSAELAPIVSAAPVIEASNASGEAETSGIEALVATADANSWLSIERRLRATPTVTGITLTGLSLGGSSRITIHYSDTREALDYGLYQTGWRLVPTTSGLLLRPREAGDPVIAPPVAAAAVPGDSVVTPPIPAPAATEPAKPPSVSVPPKGAAPVDLLPGQPK